MAEPTGLDTDLVNGLVVRPTLWRVREWFIGAPTALLATQAAVAAAVRLAIGRPGLHANCAETRDALRVAAESLNGSDAPGDTESRRQCAAMLADLERRLRGRYAEGAALGRLADVILAARYVVTAVEALAAFAPPEGFGEPARFPRLATASHRSIARATAARLLVGTVLAFLIWDVTAWGVGLGFFLNAVIGMIMFLTQMDPVTAARGFGRGALVGGLAGLVVRYLMLPGGDGFAWLAVCLAPFVFAGAWAQTDRRLGGLALGYANAFLVAVEPANRQQFNISASVNSYLALLAGTGFAILMFLLIRPPLHGPPRVRQVAHWMREHLRRAAGGAPADRTRRLVWETQRDAYVRRIHLASDAPADRATALRLLLAGLSAFRIREAWQRHPPQRRGDVFWQPLGRLREGDLRAAAEAARAVVRDTAHPPVDPEVLDYYRLIAAMDDADDSTAWHTAASPALTAGPAS